MIYNLSTILRETMKQTSPKKEKEKETNLSIVKILPKYPYNLRIDIELANRKTMELYKKYSAPSLIPKFSILDKDLNKDLNKDPDKDLNKGVLGICIFAFLAYLYFKKR
jgi:hypothetical protein